MDIAKTIKLHMHFAPDEAYEIDVVKTEYNKGGVALVGLDHEDGAPFTTFTSWLPGIPEGLVAIKDYSENEGFAAQLVAQGVIEMTGEQRFSGHAVFPLAKVLV